MNTTRTTIIVSLLALLALGCGHSEKDHHHDGDAHHHHHANTVGDLQLNNGHKWEADAHTNSVVEEMKTSVSGFGNSDDYDVLADTLTNQLNRLIAGCTMEGPAHDELHKWLVPLIENIKGLSASESTVHASDVVHEIDGVLDIYDDYFQ